MGVDTGYQGIYRACMSSQHNGEYTVTVLRPSNRGRNRRGVCAHKTTKGAKRAKRQNTYGLAPYNRGIAIYGQR